MSEMNCNQQNARSKFIHMESQREMSLFTGYED